MEHPSHCNMAQLPSGIAQLKHRVNLTWGQTQANGMKYRPNETCSFCIMHNLPQHTVGFFQNYSTEKLVPIIWLCKTWFYFPQFIKNLHLYSPLCCDRRKSVTIHVAFSLSSCDFMAGPKYRWCKSLCRYCCRQNTLDSDEIEQFGLYFLIRSLRK